MVTYWLSFCDADKPKGSQFLGVVLVDAESLEDAVRACWKAGCNPGGEVASIELPPLDELADDERADAERTYAMPRLTLMSRADIEAYEGTGEPSR